MVGICGAIGSGYPEAEEFHDSLHWNGVETATTYTDEQLAVTIASHSFDAESQPAWTDDDTVAIWLWGSIWGFDPPDREYILPNEPPAAYCATLYDEYGSTFVSGLNGNFVGLIYDQPNREITFFTDRLGTHPLHYTRTESGIVFSTNIQALPEHPAVDPSLIWTISRSTSHSNARSA